MVGTVVMGSVTALYFEVCIVRFIQAMFYPIGKKMKKKRKERVRKGIVRKEGRRNKERKG